MQIHTDNILFKARNGDKAAFGKLVAQHQQFAFNLAFRIIGDEDDALDVVQNSYIKIWKNMKRYNPKIKFTTWMYSIVSNTAIDHLRSMKRTIHMHFDDMEITDHLISDENPEMQMNNKELGRMIRWVCESLPEKQRLIFALRDLQGLSTDETVAVLDLPETSVKSNLYHARRAVREKLSKIYNMKGS